MNAIKRLFSFLTCFLFCLSSFAQDKTITGNVSASENNTPLVGVTITVKGANRTTLTDESGNFSISARSGQTLQLSYVGYANKEVTVGNENSLSVSLSVSGVNTLQDVVLVGYGTQKKANLTGAVTTVDVTKAFGSKPLNDPTKALQGLVPGLTILYGNGGLTAGAVVNIRGVGSINGSGRPLILVDNVQTDDLSIINPNDIESISVLKDAASSSIYGAGAAFRCYFN